VISRASLRLSADLVVLALGLNVWLSLVLVPELFVGAFACQPFLYVLAPLPLIPLGVGLVRRAAPWLLLGFPATLLLPLAVDAKTLAENTQSALVLVLLGASLVGFLFGSAYLTGFEGGAPSAPERQRKLGAADRVAPRWRRRRRVYAALAVLSAVFPLVLLYAVNLSQTTRAFLYQLYPDRVPAMLAVLDVGVLLTWGAIWWFAFLGPLRHHRTGDRALLRRLELLRQESRQTAPRLVFYVAVLAALAFMGALLWMRLHP